MRILITYLLILICTLSLHLAQGQTSKLDGPLNSFLNTEFMLRMKDMKIEAEVAVQNFKNYSFNEKESK